MTCAMNMARKPASQELRELAWYIRGMADQNENSRLAKAADWLERCAEHTCGQGFIGCRGGDRCTSDHK